MSRVTPPGADQVPDVTAQPGTPAPSLTAEAAPATWLYIPAAQVTTLLPKAVRAADAVVIDLEDATHPSQRAAARQAITVALADRPPVPVVVRVNQVGTDDFAADVACVGPLLRDGRLVGLRLTKIETAAQAVRPFADRPVLICQIESAVGVTNALAVASAPGVAAIMLGEADLRADLGLPRGENADDGLLLARQTVVLASRAAGLGSPVGSAFTDIRDAEHLRSTSATLRRLGFYGRSVLHPRQVEVVRDVFAATAAELAWARDVVARSDEMEAAQVASTALPDGSFVDPAVVRQARHLLARAPRQPSEPPGGSHK